MKKLTALLLCTALTVSLISGCAPTAETITPSPSSVAPSPTTGAEVKPTDTPQISGDPVYIDANAADLTGTVRFYTCFAGENGTDALIAEFNEYYPNITVESTTYKNHPDGNIGLNTAMIAGNVDVMLSFGVANTADRWSNGLLLDLTDRLAADNLDLKTEWGTDAYVQDGRAYVIPSGGLSLYVAINTEKWEAAGLGEIPTSWTWDEYLEASRAMTERDANGNTVVYGGSNCHQIDYWTYDIRQSKSMNAFYKEDGTSDFDNPLWATCLQREIDAEKEGIWYSKATYLSDSTKSRDMFLNGVTASVVEAAMTRYIVAGNPDFKIAYAPFPLNAAGETNYMGGAIPNSFVAVAKNCQNEDAAYAFAKFCATYGNKYMYAAGHAATWSGLNADEVLDVVFGSKAEAEKWIDTDTFVSCVIASGEPTYSEDYIVAFSEIQSLIEEYSTYVFNGEMSVEEAMAEMKIYADEAIADES